MAQNDAHERPASPDIDRTAPRLRELVVRASAPGATAADREALRREADAMFAAHHDRIYGVCLRLTGKPEQAAELAQDTFLTAYGRLAEYRGEGSFYAWLYGIARFTSLRANAKKRDAPQGDDPFDIEDPVRGALAALRVEERRQVLEDACRAVLGPVEQEAVLMRYVLDMGPDAITQTLGLTEASGARGLLQTCRRKLQRELQRRLEELGHGQSLLFGSVTPD